MKTTPPENNSSLLTAIENVERAEKHGRSTPTSDGEESVLTEFVVDWGFKEESVDSACCVGCDEMVLVPAKTHKSRQNIYHKTLLRAVSSASANSDRKTDDEEDAAKPRGPKKHSHSSNG